MTDNYANDKVRVFRGEHKLVLVPAPGARTRSRAKALLTIEECQAKYDKMFNTLGDNGETLPSFALFANDFYPKLSVDKINEYLVQAHNELREITRFESPNTGDAVRFQNVWAKKRFDFENGLDCATSLFVNTYWHVAFDKHKPLLLSTKKSPGCNNEQIRAIMKGLFAYEPLKEQLGEEGTRLLFEKILESNLAISPFVSASESLSHATLYGSAQGKKGQHGRLVESGAFLVKECRPIYNSKTGKLIENDDDDDLGEFGFGIVKEFEITPNARVTHGKDLNIDAHIAHEKAVVYSGSAGTPIRSVKLRVPALDEYDQNVHRDIYGLNKHVHENLCRMILSGNSEEVKRYATEQLVEKTSTHLTREFNAE